MIRIKETYCSFEVSKLLKEKGFDAQCRAAYTDYGQLFTTQIQQYITNIICSISNLWKCIAPTHQMTMKWLREEKNITIVIEPHTYDYINEKNKSYACSFWVGDNYYEYLESKDYPSYEDAVEAALKYCLENLI